MTKIFNSIFLDLQHKHIPNNKLNKLINNFSKRNINILIYNNVNINVSKYKVHFIEDSQNKEKLKFLMEGFYSRILYLKVDLDKNGNLLFFEKEQLISEKQLLEYKFIPSLQSVITDKDVYSKKMANVIKNTDQKRKKILTKYNKKIRKKFCKYYSCYDIFDRITGGIKFKDYEWELLRNTNLKKTFEEKINNSFLYLVDTDNSKILRGPDTYYYLLANKGKYKDVTLNNINEWNKNNIVFLQKCYKSLENFYVKDYLDRKLIIGLLDNIRGYNLQMLNLYTLFLFNKNEDSTFCVNITENKKFTKINTIIDITNKLLINSLFNEIEIDEVSNIINEIIYIFPQIIKKIIRDIKSCNLSYSIHSKEIIPEDADINFDEINEHLM